MNFGYKKDEQSNKDYLFSNARSGFIKIAIANNNSHIISEYTPISNQGGTSTCVANATADALEILLGLTGKVEQISRLFIYWNSRMYTKDTDKDEGTYIRNAFDSLQTLGACSESLWSFNPNKIFAQPNLFAYKQANDNKINSFYRINGSGNTRLDYIEMAVRSNHPVVFGTAVNQNFVSFYNGDGVWNPPTSNIVGNHAMIVTGIRQGVNGREFLVRNSWGENWGSAIASEKGHCWMSEDYLASPLTEDIWVPTLMESLI